MIDNNMQRSFPLVTICIICYASIFHAALSLIAWLERPAIYLPNDRSWLRTMNLTYELRTISLYPCFIFDGLVANSRFLCNNKYTNIMYRTSLGNLPDFSRNSFSSLGNLPSSQGGISDNLSCWQSHLFRFGVTPQKLQLGLFAKIWQPSSMQLHQPSPIHFCIR